MLAAGALVLGPTAAFGALKGPAYPVPDEHGGTTCVAASAVDGAAGKGTGQTWTEGGGTTSPSSATCDGTGTPPDFDLTKFAALYWGIDPSNPPGISLDGGGAGQPTAAEQMTFSPGRSNRAAGKLVFVGTTQTSGCRPAPCAPTTTMYPVDTKLTITVTNGNGGAPVVLTDPASVGLPASVGGVVSITSGVKKFAANVLFEARDHDATDTAPYQPALDYYNSHNHTGIADPQTQMSIGAVYWWEDLPPVADFTFPTPADGQPVTFTSSASDPDGTISTYAWNLGDGTSQTGANAPNATATYAPGDHTVSLTVTDDEGSTFTRSHSFSIAAPPSPGGGGDTSGAGTSGSGGGTTGSGGGTTSGGGGTPSLALVASLAAAKQKLAAVLKKGLAAALTANQAATARLKITLPKATAKKLKLKGAIGTVTVSMTGSGSKAFKVKISKKAAAKLKKLKKVTLVLAGPVTDATGAGRTVTKSITVKK